MPITAEEFEAGYCARSGITRALYSARLITLPDRTSPHGWAAVSRDPMAVRAHGDRYVGNAQRAEFDARAAAILSEDR